MTYCVYVESTNFSSQQTKQKNYKHFIKLRVFKKSLLLLLLVFKKEMKQIKKITKEAKTTVIMTSS